jgi:mRNA interferase HigB
MRVLTWRTLREFAASYPDALKPLAAWHRIMRATDFTSPHHLKETFPKASILKGGLVVFNIAGNRYRLVTRVAFQAGIVYVKWIGPHEDYDNLELD